MSNSTEITKVQVIIRRFLWETRDVVNDSESSRRWLENFRNTLQFQDLNDNPEPYALALLSEARKFNEQQLRKQQTRWVRESLKKDGITNPTKEQIETRWTELYGNETTADGDIREDPLAKHYGSAITRNETRAHDALGPSANNYGDAATRDGADESTTVSRNMRRVPQTEAPAHGFSGGRTAQGTMSRSPEAAAQSGKDYAKTRDTRDDSRGRYAPPSCSPEDGIPAETAPSHGGSVASLEARQSQARESQRRTDGHSLRVGNVARPHVRSGRNSRCPNSREEFHAFVADNNLHEGLAEEWYAIHEAREWVDKNGNPIKDWRGALYNYCTKTEQKRRTA